MKRILVSACLLGINCKYNGKNNFNKRVVSLIEKGYILIPVCPEQLGGLSTPRVPAQIQKGDGFDVLNNKTEILDNNLKVKTYNFIKGAEETLKIAKLFNIKLAIFKEKSPSCGVDFVYNNNKLISGAGVSTAFLKLNNINVLSDNFKEEELS